MRATIILAILTIVAALGAAMSFVPIYQASAAPFAPPPDSQFGGPKVGNDLGGLHSNTNPDNHGQLIAHMKTPFNQPCSVFCTYHYQYGIPG